MVTGLTVTVPAGGATGAPAGQSPTSATAAAREPAHVGLTNRKSVGEDPSFAIRGSVSGLAPGVTSQLVLKIANPFGFPISVTGLTVTVGDAGGSCVGQDLHVQPFHGPLQVPAHGTATTLLQVTLSNSSSNTCQAATWPLAYSGQAVEVGTSGGGGETAVSGSGTSGASLGNPGQNSTAPGGTGLPATGLALWVLTALAAVLLVLGAAVLLAQRRHRSALRQLLSQNARPDD